MCIFPLLLVAWLNPILINKLRKKNIESLVHVAAFHWGKKKSHLGFVLLRKASRLHSDVGVLGRAPPSLGAPVAVQERLFMDAPT